MKQTNREKGFTILEGIVIAAVALVLCFSGWWVWQNNKDGRKMSDSNNTTQINDKPTNSGETGQEASPQTQEGTAYLEIKEWGVKATLPEGMDGVVTYKLGEVVADSDGNLLQSARIWVLGSFLPNNDRCQLQDTTLGPSIDIATQFIRSESTKPFDATRYRFSFEENILKTVQHNYHLEYVTEPLCMDSGLDKVRELQTALINLSQ